MKRTGQLANILEIIFGAVLKDDGATTLATIEGQSERPALLDVEGRVGEGRLGSHDGGKGDNGSSVLHGDGWVRVLINGAKASGSSSYICR